MVAADPARRRRDATFPTQPRTLASRPPDPASGITVFRFFQSLLFPPYPQAEPAAPPKGFFAFLWHCTAGVRGAMLAM